MAFRNPGALVEPGAQGPALWSVATSPLAESSPGRKILAGCFPMGGDQGCGNHFSSRVGGTSTSERQPFAKQLGVSRTLRRTRGWPFLETMSRWPIAEHMPLGLLRARLQLDCFDSIVQQRKVLTQRCRIGY